jgi:hypothetical protein
MNSYIKKWAALLLLMLLCAVLSGIAGCRSGGQSAYAEPANYVDPRLSRPIRSLPWTCSMHSVLEGYMWMLSP